MRLTADELMFIIKAIQATTIQGKDAHLVAKILDKVGKGFERQVAKEDTK